jgi:hypothetical protein
MRSIHAQNANASAKKTTVTASSTTSAIASPRGNRASEQQPRYGPRMSDA